MVSWGTWLLERAEEALVWDQQREAEARHIRRVVVRMEMAEEEKGSPAGKTSEEDLLGIQHRIRTGLPRAPMPGVWRW